MLVFRTYVYHFRTYTCNSVHTTVLKSGGLMSVLTYVPTCMSTLIYMSGGTCTSVHAHMCGPASTSVLTMFAF